MNLSYAKTLYFYALIAVVFLEPAIAGNKIAAEKEGGKTANPSTKQYKSSGGYCGVYCLYTALKLFGVNIEPKELLKPEYIGSSKGSSLAELKKAAEDNRIYAQAVGNLTTAELCNSSYPIILHVKSNPTSREYDHYELFLGNKDGLARLFDPPNPIRLVPYYKLAPRWDGTGLIVSDKPIDLGKIFAPARKRFALYTAFGIAVILLVHYGRKKWFSLVITAFSRKQLAGLSIVQAGGMVIIALLGSLAYHFANDAGFLAHANATASIQQAHLGSFIPKISKNKIKQLLNTNTVIIDARYKRDFDAGHLQGAINIPVDANDIQRQKAMADIEKDAKIVIYCQSKGCPFAQKVTAKLKADGFNNISIYKGGYNDWKSKEEKH